MDLNLQIKPKTDDSLVASYTCPCGCNPRLAYHRGEEHTVDGCCCGNEFAVGTGAAAHLQPGEGFVQEVQLFNAPWGERIQAVWTIGQSVDPGHDHGGHGDGHDGHGDGHDGHGDAGDGHSDHADHGAGGHVHAAAGAGAASAVASAIDPVCGMTVEPEAARAKGLHLFHGGTDYFFCGKGCKLEFGDDPARFLDPSYVPSM